MRRVDQEDESPLFWGVRRDIISYHEIHVEWLYYGAPVKGKVVKVYDDYSIIKLKFFLQLPFLII